VYIEKLLSMFRWMKEVYCYLKVSYMIKPFIVSLLKLLKNISLVLVEEVNLTQG